MNARINQGLQHPSATEKRALDQALIGSALTEASAPLMNEINAAGAIMVSMAESRRAEVPNFTVGEAASITAQGNPYVFRTSFGQSTSFPRLARYINAKQSNADAVFVDDNEEESASVLRESFLFVVKNGRQVVV